MSTKTKDIHDLALQTLEKRLQLYCNGKNPNVAGLCLWFKCTLKDIEHIMNQNDEKAYIFRIYFNKLIEMELNKRQITPNGRVLNNIKSDWKGMFD